MVAFGGLVIRRVRAAAVLAICLALIPSAVAFADTGDSPDASEHDYGEMVRYDLVFPVLGDYSLWDTFYAVRASGEHHAQDIMADKMTPVVAAASGTIRYINWTRDATQMWTNGRCCTMTVRHDDGWESWYIHLNNDTPGTDDGLGWGIADGLEPGDRVEAGQLIGWVGDSGNAEFTPPHLHFELRDPAGVIVNPYEALLAAETIDAPFLVIARGATGQRVLQLQTMLTVLGFDPGPADGIFGTRTESALLAFQTATARVESGVVGGETWNALVEAYLGAVQPPVRLSGADRYETAAAIADARYPGTADIVFLAVGSNYPDAIGGGPAAASLGAPILLVGFQSVPESTRATLQRLDPHQVYVLGGEAAIHADVERSVRDLLPGAAVSRLSGPTRFDTAVAVSQAVFSAPVDTVYVVTGRSFPDALVAAPAAVAAGGPVLLVERDSIPPSVLAELERLSPRRIVVVGGRSAVSTSVYGILSTLCDTIVRVAGADRYATAALVSEFAFSDSADTVYVAVGDRFPDALAGGAATRMSPGPLLLVGSDAIPLVVAAEIRRHSPQSFLVFGGPAAVSESVGTTIAGLPATTGPALPDPSLGDGAPEIVYDPSQGSEQWRPLVEYVFGLWGLDTAKCGTGDRSGDCVGGQVDNAIVIMQCESFGDPEIVNPASGTTGLFQHRPVYWQDRVARVRKHFPGFSADAVPTDPYDNVMVAALLVHESRDALLGENTLTGPWDDGPEPWGHWDGSSRTCADPPLVSP